MPSLIAALARAFRTSDPVEYQGIVLKRAWDYVEQGYEVHVGDVGMVWRGITRGGEPFYHVTAYDGSVDQYTDSIPKACGLLPIV